MIFVRRQTLEGVIPVVEFALVCNEHLCDDCGDCLVCYGDFPCTVGNDDAHWLTLEMEKK